MAVHWPMDKTYYPCVVAEQWNGSQTNEYDDAGIMTLKFELDVWHYSSTAQLFSKCASFTRPETNAPSIIDSMLDYFGNNFSFKCHAEAFPSHVLFNSYRVEELCLNAQSMWISCFMRQTMLPASFGASNVWLAIIPVVSLLAIRYIILK